MKFKIFCQSISNWILSTDPFHFRFVISHAIDQNRPRRGKKRTGLAEERKDEAHVWCVNEEKVFGWLHNKINAKTLLKGPDWHHGSVTFWSAANWAKNSLFKCVWTDVCKCQGCSFWGGGWGGILICPQKLTKRLKQYVNVHGHGLQRFCSHYPSHSCVLLWATIIKRSYDEKWLWRWQNLIDPVRIVAMYLVMYYSMFLVLNGEDLCLECVASLG